jgi:uncharacterized protein YkwD
VAVVLYILSATAARGADSALSAAVEQNLYQQFNQLRVSRALAPLARDEQLASIARAHSADMLEEDYFGHTDPRGAGPSGRVADADRRLVGLVGENLWSGFYRPGCASPGYAASLAREALDRFLGSEPHRRNLLRAGYTNTGFGVVIGAGRVLVTQLLAEVKGYTSEAIPREVRRGQLQDFRLAGDADGAAGFDIRPLVGAIPLAVPFAPGEMRVSLPAGDYRLYFYFRERGAHRYRIFPGPEFRVVAGDLGEPAGDLPGSAE